MSSSETKKVSKKSKNQQEFEEYMKNQCLRTTFNGIEIESFSWYRKMLGVK